MEYVNVRADGELFVSSTRGSFDLNYHPETPDLVELGQLDNEGVYQHYTMFSLGELKAFVHAIEDIEKDY